MKTSLAADGRASYELPLGDALVIPLEPLLGKPLTLAYQGKIHCIHCGRRTGRSFNQGYCFPCFRKLARCDSCIVKPELCHYDQGTCREEAWARANCLQPHVVYLANSSGLKVGITRKSQVPARWIDQGATQALPVLEVASRHLAGVVEVILKQHLNDRTQWQRMLKGEAEPLDLAAEWERVLARCRPRIDAAADAFGAGSVRSLPAAGTVTIGYPVLEYPATVRPFSLDKKPEIRDTLMGIKGQYLILAEGVINIRKFAGYEVTVEVPG